MVVEDAGGTQEGTRTGVDILIVSSPAWPSAKFSSSESSNKLAEVEDAEGDRFNEGACRCRESEAAFEEKEADDAGNWTMAFYNVLWVKADGDAIYRRGLGTVGKEAWDRLKPTIVAVKLG